MVRKETEYRVKEMKANLDESSLLNTINAQAVDGYELVQAIELRRKIFLVFKRLKREIL